MVDGRHWSPDLLHTALRTAQSNSAPIELVVENEEFSQTVHVHYHGGERYPQLERDSGKPDLLSEILTPLTR
jgi:hypothetical protein